MTCETRKIVLTSLSRTAGGLDDKIASETKGVKWGMGLVVVGTTVFVAPRCCIFLWKNYVPGFWPKIGAPQKRPHPSQPIPSPTCWERAEYCSGSTVSNTQLSEFFGPHGVPGRELSELLSAYHLCAKANSPSFSAELTEFAAELTEAQRFPPFSETVSELQTHPNLHSPV